MMKILALFLGFILVSSVLLSNQSFAVEPNSKDSVGLKKGQWVRYIPILNINADPSLETAVRDLISMAKDLALVETLEDIEWVELKVVDIQGNEVTFSKTINKNGNIQQREPSTVKIQNEKPSLIISTNVNLGHTLETPDGFAPITLVGIKNLDSYIGICFVNPDLCEEKNVETLRFSSFRETSQNNVELLTEIEYVYEKSTGILLRQYIILDICTSDYSECGLVEMGLEVIDFSIDGPTIIGKIDPASPSKQEILKRLSEFFVKTQDSRFLITDGQESIYGPIKTTYDIFRMKDNSWLGTLIIYGDEEVTSVTTNTAYDIDERTINDASDILQLIRLRLVPDCCGGIENHYIMFTKYFDDKQHSNSKTFGNIDVSLGWVHNDEFSATGFFSQEITYPTKDSSFTENIETPSIELSGTSTSKLQSITTDFTINIYDPSIDEISKKLSPYFVKNNGNPFWITNEKDTGVQWDQTSYQILRVSDNQQIGRLLINDHGDEFSVNVWTDFYSTENSVDFSSKIQQIIRETLFPTCFECVDDHRKIWSDNVDSGGPVRNYEFIGDVDVVMIMPTIDSEKREFGQVFEFPVGKSEGGDPTDVVIDAFIVLGIPAIIIGLIIWKLIQRKARKKKMLDADWKGV